MYDETNNVYEVCTRITNNTLKVCTRNVNNAKSMYIDTLTILKVCRTKLTILNDVIVHEGCLIP